MKKLVGFFSFFILIAVIFCSTTFAGSKYVPEKTKDGNGYVVKGWGGIDPSDFRIDDKGQIHLNQTFQYCYYNGDLWREIKYPKPRNQTFLKIRSGAIGINNNLAALLATEPGSPTVQNNVSRLLYGVFDGTQFQFKDICYKDPYTVVGNYIDFDSNGNPMMIYSVSHQPRGGVIFDYFKIVDGNTTKLSMPKPTNLEEHVLALDSKGNAHILYLASAYQGMLDFDLFYRAHGKEQKLGRAKKGVYSLAVDSEGLGHACYFDYKEKKLIYYKFKDGGPIARGVVTDDEYAEDNGIGVGPDGTTYIIYRSETDGGDGIKISMTKDGKEFAPYEFVTGGKKIGYSPGITFSPNGKVLVSFTYKKGKKAYLYPFDSVEKLFSKKIKIEE